MQNSGIARRFLLGFVAVLMLACSARAEFTDAYVQVSVFLSEITQGNEILDNGNGRFGYGFTDVPPAFSWGSTINRSPTVTTGWAGFEAMLAPLLAGYNVKNGTGVYQWNGVDSTAKTYYSINAGYTWTSPTEVFTGIVWAHYVLQGRVGPNPGDKCEFGATIDFYTGDGGHIPLQLHYLNDQPGSTFSGVDLYAEAPCTFHAINGNSRTEFVIIENTAFLVRDPGQSSLSGVGNVGPAGGGGGPSPTPPPIPPHPGLALNISTRMRVLNGDNVLIGGFIITGTEPKKVGLRALGPSLSGSGVPDALQDPVIELHDSTGATIAFDNDWMDSQAAEIQQAGLAPTDTREAALVRTLSPGSYTAIVRGNADSIGAGIVEVYDIDTAADSTLANISTRGFADTGDNVMIGGFILGDSGSDAAHVIVRAVGPSLGQVGIPNALADPTLELHNGNGALIQSNDNWKDTQQAEVEAAGLALQDDRESAMAALLPVGNYTAIVRGANGTSGVATVEAYKLP